MTKEQEAKLQNCDSVFDLVEDEQIAMSSKTRVSSVPLYKSILSKETLIYNILYFATDRTLSPVEVSERIRNVLNNSEIK